MKVYQTVFFDAAHLNNATLRKVACSSYKSALILLLLLGTLLPAKAVQAQQNKIFVPMILTGGPSNLNAADSDRVAACPGLTPEEIDMALEFFHDSGQRRPVMKCNPTLAAVARARAQDMVDRAYFGHVNPNGYGPDWIAERAGYNLPEWYDITRDSNHIESIAAGGSYPTAEKAWDALMTSPTHRTHLRGLEQFFIEQSEFGIGRAYSPNSRYRTYWVILTAHPAE